VEKILVFILGLFILAKPAFAVSYPSPTGNLVSDFANILSSDQKHTLENNLLAFEQKTSIQIVVVTIKSLEGDTIENYAVKLFENWKIGQKGKDNGLLLLVAIDDHKLKIEVGYGLEGQLNDAKAGDIIRNTISPEFKNGNYYQGITNGLERIESNLTGEEKTPAKTDSNAFAPILIMLGILGWFVLPILVYVAAFFGRSKHIWPGGLVGLIIGIIIGGLIAGVFGGLIGLFLDWILSTNYQRLQKMGKATGWRSTGGGFFGGWGSSHSSGSGGGFGGFGGGSSGGGGASGSW